MTVADRATRHYGLLQRIKSAAVRVARLQWHRLPQLDAVPAYQREVGPQIAAALMLAQMAAADEADTYTSSVLRELLGDDRRVEREGRINARGFAGTAADGRPLDSLLMQPIAQVQRLIDQGMRPSVALSIGEGLISRIVATETTDAGRTADGAAIVARPQLRGYVRMLTPPSCARCAVLAGRVYRWNEGFERHPLCDCVHVPAAEDTLDDIRTDPRKAVLGGLVTGLSKADEQAIRDGADPGQVINAHRGMYTAANGWKSTRAGTTRRGFAFARFRQQTGRRITQRLRPESIYEIAGDDREEALRLLHLHGYLL